MTLVSFEVRCTEKDISTIILILTTRLNKLHYRIKKKEDDQLGTYSIHIIKNLFHWVVKFEISLVRTGNIVKAEISRKEPLALDKIISKRLIKRQRNNKQKPFYFSIFRFWWIFYIVSFIGSFLLGFIPTDNPISIIGYILVGILGGFLIFYFGSIYFNQYQRKSELERAELLGMQIKSILESIDEVSLKTTVVCWSCFKEVIPVKRKCPNCKVELVKVE